MKIGTVEVNGLMTVPERMPIRTEKTEGGWVLTYESRGIKSYYGGHDTDLDSGKITLYFFEDPARAHVFGTEGCAAATAFYGEDPEVDILVKLSRLRRAGDLIKNREGQEHV